MKKNNCFILLLIISLNAFSQSEKQIWFKPINWKITVPEGFKLNYSLLEEKSYHVSIGSKKEIVFDIPKSISAFNINATKGVKSHFSVSIAINDVPNSQVWDSLNNEFTKTFLSVLLPTKSKFDTLSTNRAIDGLDFKEFQINVKINKSTTQHYIFLQRLYSGFKVRIYYFFVSDIDKQAIEKSLNESKFIATSIGVINN